MHKTIFLLSCSPQITKSILMRKLFPLIFFSILLCFTVKAQVAYYNFRQTSGTYNEVTGGTVFGTTTSDDQRFVDPASPAGSTSVLTGVGIPIGFSFMYNNIAFDRLAINNNGWISLGQSSLTPSVDINSTSIYIPLSSTSTNTPALLRNRIAAFGRDLGAQTGSELRVETTNTAPNRVCVVQFKNYKRYGTSGTGDNLNFQIRLNETTNDVEIVYGTVTFGTGATTSSSAQIGLGGTTSTDFNIRRTQSTNDWNTTIAGTTNTDACQLPFTGVTVTPPASGTTFTWTYPPVCGSIPSSQPTGISLSTVSNTSISGTFSASSPASPGYLVVRTTTNTPPVPVNGVFYPVGISNIGFIESNSAATSFVSTSLLPATQYYYWIFSYTGLCYGGSSSYLTANPLTGSANTSAAGVVTTTALGGLWSSTATWVGGVLPSATDDVTIADGATVTIDGSYTVNKLTIGQGTSGILQWNNTATQPLTVNSDILINTSAKLLDYRLTNLGGHTINVGGNFTNNGYAMMASSAATINFNGLNGSQTLNGIGTFQGNGTSGIIGGLLFQNPSGCTINTTQNLLTTYLAHTAGTLTTNGKLTIDNTAQVFGQAINTQVASAAVTTVGAGYVNAPVVFGVAVTLWTASGAATLNTRYFSGNNVYLATAAGTFDAATAPTHTSGSVSNGTVPLLWLGTLGTLGNPFITTTLTLGTQYFYGGNLYTAVATTASTTPPTHTTGTVGSFLYVGTPAQVSVNYDATTQSVRSLNIINAGSGYSSAPAVAFSLNGGTVTTSAVATATVIQSYGATTSSSAVVNGGLTVTGALNINSNQNATSFSGVGGLITTGGGVNYSVAPTVGFAGPTAINLVTNAGSGYTAAPTITVTGGTLVSGSALTSSNFAITVANGQIVSVYLNASTTATYSVPPTLAFSAGNATLAFPVGCWPAATAIIGANGQITNLNITNAGFGYVTAPTVGFGTTSGTATGGTFTTVATAPTAVLALYNITYGWYLPATSSVSNNTAAYLPSNGKLNSITIASAAGASIANNIELFASSPLTLTSGVLDMGSNTITFANTAYAGASGNATASVSGNIQLSTPGGSVTRTFPYEAPVAVATGTGSLATGSTVTRLRATRTAAPTGSVNGGIASLTGSRSYRVQANSGSSYGTQPTITLNYNATDALTTPNNADLLIVQAAATSGAWAVRSVSSGTGTLSTTGSRTTATSGVGPIVPTGDDYFAWATSLPCSGTPTTGVISGSTDACSNATISFTSSVFSSGNGMTYRWQTSPDGTTWTNTTVTTPGAYSQTFTAPVWIRRVDTCTNGNAFAVSNVIQVSLRPSTLCYCGPNTGTTIHSSNSSAINSVAITGTTLNNSNTGVGNTTNGYIEFPASGSTTATLLQGASYDLLTTLASSGSLASVWIDYDRNGTYESTEWVQITTSAASAGIIVTTPISIPVNASVGLTGMRIRTRSSGANGAANACTSFASGETEEYYITIATPPSCSGTPTAGTVTGPSSAVCVGSNVTLTATGFTSGVGGLTYRWQSSLDNISWTNTTGTNPTSFTTTVTANTWFRLVDTCTNGNAFGISNAVQATVTSPSNLPISEGFNTSTSLPTCWSRVIVATQTASKITVVTSASNPTAAPQEGTNFIMYSSYSSTGGSAGSEERLVSLPVNTTGVSNIDVTFQWYEINGSLYNSGNYLNEGVTLEWSTDGTNWNTSTFFPRHVATASSTGEWKSKVVTLPAGAGNQAALLLAFKFRSEFGYNCYLDKVEITATGTFPVTITSFKGEKRGLQNWLTWTTATEQNNKGFELQRSADGVNYSTLSFVNSKAINGNSNTTLDYTFTDTKPFAGNSYYRLKQVDHDGKESLSQVLLLKGTKGTQLDITSIYPNPTTSQLNVLMSAPLRDKVTILITDVAGKVLVQRLVNVVPGDNSLQLDVSKLASGTYIMKAICENGCDSGSKKFMKQ